MLDAYIVTLCALVTGQRYQTLYLALDIEYMHGSESKAVFHIKPLLKTNLPRSPTKFFLLFVLIEKTGVYMIKSLKHLLFISTLLPHGGNTKYFLAR